MPRETLHENFTRNYVFFMILRDLFDLEKMCRRFQLDLRILHQITARYLRGRTPVLKLGNIELAWKFEHSE